MTLQARLTLGVLAATAAVGLGASVERLRDGEPLDAVHAATQPASTAPTGQSATSLPDGRWLLLGGVGTERTATLWDSGARTATPTSGRPEVGRAYHTATVLADGRVLIVGGQQGNAIADLAEVFDPTTGQFTALAMRGSVARALHTATLLTDGRVLVTGGSNGGPTAAPTELWDVTAQTVVPIDGLPVGRVGHQATLMSDGRVLVSGGRRVDGAGVSGAEVIDAQAGSIHVPAAPVTIDRRPVTLSGALPINGATDVPIDEHLALRFSDAMAPATLTSETISLAGPSGIVSTRIVVAEQGRLAFVWPTEPLAEGTTYTLRVSGAASVAGQPLVPASLVFTTVVRAADSAPDAEEWIPDASARERGRWRANRPPSPWETLDPLMAPGGVTAISGRALTLDGRPLPNVTFRMADDRRTTTSDRTGRFLLLLESPTAGRRVLHIDGTTATRGRRTYGFFEYGFNVVSGQTNVLPFTIWMQALDTAHAVRIASPTTSEVVITTSYIPGLELHIPPNTVLRGRDGKPVREVTLTAIPVDRPPFPLAKNVEVPVYFTAQPGGAYVHTAGTGPKGAWLVYPNYQVAMPNQRVQFFHYDPEIRDWYVYGLGTVTPNGAQVTPDPTTRLYEFTGAMINPGDSPPNNGGKPGNPTKGDPVDPATGVFLMHNTDLYLPDTIPITLTRTYNSGDNLGRPFGTGMTHPYAMFLWSANQYTEADLILPEGGKVHFVRTSPGTGWTDAVFVHQETQSTSATPTPFYKATIAYNGNGWDLTLKDGTIYVFGDNAPLQAIRDRYGNQVTVVHANGQAGNVTGVVSPNGRWLAFTYDGSNRITEVKDNIGRTVSYTYTNGNLTSVTNPENKVTTYGYDGSNRLTTITDGRNTTYLTNTYTNNRVTTQTLADPTYTFQYNYSVNGSGLITQTDITDPRGLIERLAFNPDGYIVSETEAVGDAKERTTTFSRQAGTNLVTSQTDPLSRRTEYTYDSAGRVLTVTRLAATVNAITTTYTYESRFGQPATVTDPLNHTWTMTYDGNGVLTGMTDPLSHQTTVNVNGVGQVVSVTDALNHSWQYGYSGWDRVSTTNALGAVWSHFVDGGGRLLSVTDPLGRTTQIVPDKLNRTTSVFDASNGQTSFYYDANSNLLSVTDALSHTTTYAYDGSDRVITRTDPLNHANSYQYDGNNNLTQTTDRKSQVTSRTYDTLNRLSQLTFYDNSTVAYTYDAGDRLTQIVDSINGTITRGYDDLDRLTSEATAEGTVSYTYDDAGRRATMTVAGQTAVSYAYDNANRLISITQGSSSVSVTYDDADRRSTLTFPNGVVLSYGYDDAGHITALTYTAGAMTLGTLTYAYDVVGRRTSVGGTWARTGLPQALSLATYDAANRVATWAGTSFSYDLNGNLTGDGSNTYTWNARDQLGSIIGGLTANFGYDGFGRRRTKTVGGLTGRFLYDGANLTQELSAAGTPVANVLAGDIDEVFVRTDGAGTRAIARDVIGSTVALIDDSSAVQTQYTYDPYGDTATTGPTSSNPIQYVGRENDSANLYFYRSRFYVTTMLRFSSEDPLGLRGGMNLFAYANNQPTMLSDPFGLKPKRPGPPPRRRGTPGNPGRDPRKPDRDPRDPDPDPDRDPDDPIRDPKKCPPWIDRAIDDFKLTNKLPGMMVPTGLNIGLRSAGTFGEAVNMRTIGQVLSQEGLTVDGLLEAGFTHAGAALATGLAYETGVAIGSGIRAAFERCR